MVVIDKAGYRLNVGIILMNASGRVFWGRRFGHDAWQFPQGGVAQGETIYDALYRELKEEVGLDKQDVCIIGVTKRWLKYKLPDHYLRHTSKPLVIGQKQKWFLLRLCASEQKLRLDLSQAPEFDSWRWIDYTEPPKHVIFFKQEVYRLALDELRICLNKKKTARYFKKSTGRQRR